MNFQKQDLKNTHYNWPGDIFTGQPSRRSFDRFNGNQVLFLINFYGSLSEQFTRVEAEKIERKILFEMPDDAKSEIAAFNWLRRTELIS